MHTPDSSTKKSTARIAFGSVFLFLALFLSPFSPSGVSSATPEGDIYWTDCSGPSLCTRYWTRPKTKEFHNTIHQWWWQGMSNLGMANFLAPSLGLEGTSLGGFEDAINRAVLNGGCLQYAWRQDGTGTGIWDYTTHSGYCWDKFMPLPQF